MEKLEQEKEHKMKTSIFFIEANSFERMTLWRQYRDNWMEDSMGFSQIIGYLDKKKKQMPVNVCFCFAKLYDQQICFYEVVSRYNDTVMVDKFFDKHYPVKYDNGYRRAITNVDNFHNVVNEVSRLYDKQIRSLMISNLKELKNL